MAEEMNPFEAKPAAKPDKHMDTGADMAAQINNVGRALKIVEDKQENLRKKVQISEENILSNNKRISDSTKLLQSDVLEIKRDIEDIKEKIRLVVKELKMTAKEEDIKMVQKYLDIWEPVEFATRNEVRKMIEKAIDEKFK